MKRTPEQDARAYVVLREYGGIIPYAEAFYLQSILYSVQLSEVAFQALDSSIEDSDPADITFACLQEALTHASAVSRFFFPPRTNDRLSLARSEKLRHAFGLSDDSALANRRLRDALEHYDERLDLFLLQHPFGTLQPWPVVGTVKDDLQGTLHRFKLLDPSEGVCVILGEFFEFVPIRLEVQAVLALALRFLEDGLRLPNNDARTKCGHRS